MIDPGWLGSIGPIVLGAGVGLAVRKALAGSADQHVEPAEPRANVIPRHPRIRPAAPAAARR